MKLEEILGTFIIESRELLAQMEAALLQIEQAPDEPELINAIFRAAHTIKGSAGLFSLHNIVTFTHVAESVLDRVRDGRLRFDEALAALFLQVCDQLGSMIEHVDKHQQPGAEDLRREADLLVRLQTYLVSPAAEHTLLPAVAARSEACADRDVPHGNWHLSLRFGADVLRNGMDPISILHYLGTLGRIAGIVAIVDAVPAGNEMDPESCYLGFELSFDSAASEADIAGAFEFVRDDSQIRILPPGSSLSAYRELIRSLPEDEEQLGEALVDCGSITTEQLASLLAEEPPESVRPELAEVVVVPPSQTDSPTPARALKSADSNLIRVEAGKLDRLINLIGELIIAGSGANLAAQRAGAAELVETTATLSRLVEEVRDSALSLRMVQIGTTFNRFQRVVRDVAKELGKEIDLVINGAETELDKTVVEKIGDPLTHLIRNAIDHGIGLPHVREARGKPRRGTIRLNAYHDGDSIVIEVSDDGSGLKKEKILQRALERGLIAEPHNLADKDIYNLIFEPGFSTAEQVSNLSGRGVGMDVVKRNIEALRGTVDLTSVVGQGTTFHIRLPLTLAIIDGFLVGVGNASYVVPQDTVLECIELSEATQQIVKGRSYLDLRGEVLPFIRLRELFEMEGPSAERENVVVVQYGDKRAGLVVDRLMGEFQTVIKPLGRIFSQSRGFGGFTILGSGEVALVLDVPSLIGQVAKRLEPRQAPKNFAMPTA
jgi:two-component system chemotaxis sensor kinase CheA